MTSQAIDFITLRRRPAAKTVDTLQQPEPQNLGVFADAGELDRLSAGRNRIARREFNRLPRAVLEFGGAANDAIDDDLAFFETAGLGDCRGALRQE